MDISVLTTTSDIEQLRTLALAMVQNSVAENAERKRELQSKDVALQEKEHRICDHARNDYPQRVT